jgi:ethanolamine utilization cobalamin adenosyltransferase
MKSGSGKPEYMTSLSGDRMVPKTNGRIIFRGKVDSLEAEFIEAQVLASRLGEEEFCGYLGEILDFLRALMAAEVKDTPLLPPLLFGMDAEEIHRRSHAAAGKTFIFPSYTQGPLAARLNSLRAHVRELELLAVRVFGPEEIAEAALDEREDIILALNRLSSALWWLFLRHVN